MLFKKYDVIYLSLVFGLSGLISGCGTSKRDSSLEKKKTPEVANSSPEVAPSPTPSPQILLQPVATPIPTAAPAAQILVPVTQVLLKDALNLKWTAGGGAAKMLAPSVVMGLERDASLPGEKALNSSSDLVISQDTIVFTEVLKLYAQPAQSNSFYLVWDGNALGAPIEDAYFVHEVVDTSNRKVNTHERKNASWDKERNKWFIPLTTLLEGCLENADPSYTHWLNLELHLPESIVVNLKVGLRMVGPLPAVGVDKNICGDLLPPLATFGEKMSSGWALGRITIQNPSKRKFHLWVKGGGSPLESVFVINQTTFANGNINADSGEMAIGLVSNRFFSKALLRADLLNVYQVNGNNSVLRETLTLSMDELKKVVLNPNEKLLLEWQTGAWPQVSHRHLPDPKEMVFKWEAPFPPLDLSLYINRMLDELRRRVVNTHREARRTETWDLVGTKLEGVWNRVVFLADENIELKDFSSEGAAHQLLIDNQNIQVHINEGDVSLDGAQPFSVQGYF